MWPKMFLNGLFYKHCPSLAPPSSVVDNAKAAVDGLFRLLQDQESQSLDRCRLVGGLAKKTSTSLKMDADLVIFVNADVDDVLKFKKSILNTWEDILLVNTELKESDIKKTVHSLKFRFKEVDIDLLPAINFDVDSNKQLKSVLAMIKRSRKPELTACHMSAELTELSLDFVKKKSSLCHEMARLAKFWGQTLLHSEYLAGKSTILELLGIKAAMEEEKAGHPTHQGAFRRFLVKMKDLSTINLVFQDYYSLSDIPSSVVKESPLLLDPTNPYNNLLSSPGTYLEVFSNSATSALEVLDKMSCQVAELDRVFQTQPLLHQIPEMVREIGMKQFSSRVSVCPLAGWDGYPFAVLMPALKVRVKIGKGRHHALENLLRTYTGVVKRVEAENMDVKPAEVQEVMQRTVDKMDNAVGRTWTTTTSDKHEDKNVSLVMPLFNNNNPTGQAVILSFDLE